MYRNRSITVIIPALNEEPSIACVISELSALGVCAECGAMGETYLLHGNGLLTDVADDMSCMQSEIDSACASCQKNTARSSLIDNIIMCDNGSSDNTAAIAKACGAIVVEEHERGYGAACLAAMAHPIEKDIVVFVDGDHSVVCAEMPALLDPLLSGADLVIGSRTLGKCEAGALSLPQRFGNHLASAIMRLIWKTHVTDLGPFRAISNPVLKQLQMRDRQFGWTVEMQVRALQLNLQVTEVPVTTRKRIGQSKISGTVSGVIGAARGILGTIAVLYWRGLRSKYVGAPSASTISSVTCQVATSADNRDEK